MPRNHVPPKTLRAWVRDIPGGELYELLVFDDRTVWSTVGRYAFSAGSANCSWEEFVAGGLDHPAVSSVGASAVLEAKQFVAALLARHSEAED